MSNTDLLDEIEEDFDILSDTERSPDVSLSAVGDEISDPFDAPGGVTFFDMTFHDSGRYTVKAVGQTAEDESVKIASDETPVEHRVITNLDEGTFILNVDAKEGTQCDVDVYFTSPESVSLPVKKSGRGNDFIGPIAHEGFINISIVNYDTGTLKIQQPKSSGNRYLNSPGFRVDSSNDNQGTSKEEMMSTKDGYKNYPWIYIKSDGEWEIKIDAP